MKPYSLSAKGEKWFDLADHIFKKIPIGSGRITTRECLKPMTWFKVGGIADLFYQPNSLNDLIAFLEALPIECPVTVLGYCSNVLIRDTGLRGVVIQLKELKSITHQNDTLYAEAGCHLMQIAKYAAHHGIGGLEFFRGIPGSLGGAIAMNAGANGKELSDVLLKVYGVDRFGNRFSKDRKDIAFGYRNACLPEHFVITGAQLSVFASSRERVEEEQRMVQEHRERSQPIRERTGGSTFKNLPGIRAWEIIDRAGCRGLTLGGAKISQHHCNFMYNTGSATALELESLGELVRHRVKECFDIQLEWEIKRIGDPVPPILMIF